MTGEGINLNLTHFEKSTIPLANLWGEKDRETRSYKSQNDEPRALPIPRDCLVWEKILATESYYFGVLNEVYL